MTLTELFTNIANAIRAKTGDTASIKAEDFPEAIQAISAGVEGGIIPTGTKSITANGTHDVTAYAAAEVNVSAGGITPSGSISVTANGTYDITDKASVVVNVPVPTQKTVVRTITISSDITGANALITHLTNDDFIKEHYADEGFSAMMFALTPVTSESNVIHSIYQGNKNIGSSNVARYGFMLRSSSASAVGTAVCGTAVNGSGYGSQFRVDSSGNLKQYLAAGHIWKAGTYNIVLTCIS